jgi:vanillin dehydrogenase
MTALRTTGERWQQFIAGEWSDAENGRSFEDPDPYTGESVADVPAGGRDDVRRAIDAAAGAFPGWSRTPPAERHGVFLKAAEALERRRDEVVSLLARETGSTFGFGMFEMEFVPNLLRQAAALAYAPLGEVLPSDSFTDAHWITAQGEPHPFPF